MSLPVFIDLSESDQVSEIRAYLKSRGAEISEQPNGHGLVAELSDIIRACPACANDPEADVEQVFNSVIALLLFIPHEQAEPLVKSLCDTMRPSPARIRVLSNLFYGLDEMSPNRYYVYNTLLKLGGKAELLHLINPSLDEVKRLLKKWNTSQPMQQQLLRSLYDAMIACKQTEKATKVMIELLSTYTDENASQARDDAHKCIVSCLADPSYFLLDHLLNLKPVKFLEGELIHDLLTIFVSGRLNHYMDFYTTNTDFVRSIGLSHEHNMQKMRILTFMQLAENRTEIDFDSIQKEMNLNADDVESFIIDVVSTKTVRAKINQLQRKVVVSSTTHRTFGRQQWQTLRTQLMHWQNNMTNVMSSLSSLQTMTPTQH